MFAQGLLQYEYFNQGDLKASKTDFLWEKYTVWWRL